MSTMEPHKTEAREDRLPPLPEAQWTDAQRAQAQEIIAGPRGKLISPFVPLLRSPELMGHCQRMGEYLRYRNTLGQRLTELAILVTARFWDQGAEWAIHAPIAQSEGVDRATIDAIAHHATPSAMPRDEQVVYEVCTEILRDKALKDATWAASVALWGEQGVMDLVGTVGYYSLLAMVMNAAQTPAPATGASLPIARA